MKQRMRKGFTLIELIATIAILGVVVALSIYISMNVIGKSKDKSYQITINNIESKATNYLDENSGKLFFVSGGNQKEYQCITVGNLVDMGYFDENITESKISNDKTVGLNDYIYLERNSESKTVTKSVYLNPNLDNYSNVCGVSINASGDIRFVVTPSTGFSKSKEVTIYYRVKNGLNINDYQNNYQYENLSGQIVVNEEDVESSTKVTVTENGTMYAEIEGVVNASQAITGIDNEGPDIKINYSGSKYTNKDVTIPFVITDSQSGVDYGSISKDDFTVRIGDKEVISGFSFNDEGNGKYSLEIKNVDSYNEYLSISIDENKIFDNVENGNDEIIFSDIVLFDNINPTCILKVNTSEISFDSKSADVNAYGINNSTTASYGNDTLSLALGNFYGHVKDNAGNIGTCSATITKSKVSKWTATYKTCSRSSYVSSYDCCKWNSGYYYCSAGYLPSSSSSSVCYKKFASLSNCYDGCSQTCYYAPNWGYSYTGYVCSDRYTANWSSGYYSWKYSQSSCSGSWDYCDTNYGYSYYFSESSSTVSACSTGNSFTCNSTNYGYYYTSGCTPKEYSCSFEKEQLLENNSYCYQLN